MERKDNDSYNVLVQLAIRAYCQTEYIQTVWDGTYYYGYCPDYKNELLYAAARGSMEMFKYILDGFENGIRYKNVDESVSVKEFIDIATDENKYGADIVKFLESFDCEQIISTKRMCGGYE